MEEEICLVDSCTINSILKEIKYFQTLTKRTRNILIIVGRDVSIVGSGKSYYNTFHGYTNNNQEYTFVSQFDTYPTKL
jgi:hypothetical protein